jgi:hypothetical protein
VNIYITGNVLGKGGTLQVYTGGKLTLRGTAAVNLNTEQPFRVNFRHGAAVGAAGMEAEALLRDGARAFATFHVPDATLRLTGTAQLNGVAIARELALEGGSALRTSILGGTSQPGLMVGETLSMKDTARVEGLGGGPALGVVCVGPLPAVSVANRAAVRGDAYVGPGGTAGPFDISVGSSAVLTGQRGVLTAPVSIALPAAPAPLPLPADLRVSSGTTVLLDGMQVNDLVVGGTAIAEVPRDATIVVAGDLEFRGLGRLRVAPGAKLTVFVGGRFVAADDAEVNAGGTPDGLLLNLSGSGGAFVVQQARACGRLAAPAAQVKVTGGAHLYGSVLARRLRVEQDGQFHADARPPRLRWMEQ